MTVEQCISDTVSIRVRTILRVPHIVRHRLPELALLMGYKLARDFPEVVLNGVTIEPIPPPPPVPPPALRSSRKTSKPKIADPPPVEKLLYSREDAAYALSISVRALDYRIAEGKIKTQREGNKVMITAAELKRYARSDNPARFK